MASFADQLKGFKSLMSTREEDEAKAKAKEARGTAAEEEARKTKEELSKRLISAGATVREKGFLDPIPERKMALLILIIDSLPFEALWKEWLQRHDGRTQVKVWIHAKHPEKITSKWVKSRLLPNSFKPEWGSVEITRAEVELLRVALEESRSAIRFLFASESCIPLLPLDLAADLLFNTYPQSWINYRSSPNNGYSNQQQFQPLLDAGLPREHIWKADQWVVLTRTHAEALLELPKALREEVWPFFKKVSASDEMFFPTCLSLLGELGAGNAAATATTSSSTQTDTHTHTHIAKRRVTYCHWGDSPKSPETYEGLQDEVLKKGVEEGCIFARKFKPGTVSVEEWMRHMRGLDGGKQYLLKEESGEEGNGKEKGKEEKGGRGEKDSSTNGGNGKEVNAPAEEDGGDDAVDVLAELEAAISGGGGGGGGGDDSSGGGGGRKRRRGTESEK